MESNQDSGVCDWTQQDLEQLFYNAGIGLWIIDVQGPGEYRLSVMNRINEQLFGLEGSERNQNTNLTLNEYLGSEIIDYVVGLYDEVCATGKPVESVTQAEINGQKDWWLVHLVPILDENGDVIRIIGTGVTITKQKDQEAELRKREAYLKTIFQAAENIAFVITDLQGEDTRITDFSPGAEKVFGYTQDEIIGQRVAVLHLPEDVKNFPAMQELMRNGKKGYSGETTLVYKTGESFPAMFTVHPLITVDGQFIGTVGTTIDISERKRSELALARSEERYRLLADNTTDVIWVISMDGRFTYVNPAIERVTGYSPKEWLELSVGDVIPVEEHEKIKAIFHQVLASPKPRVPVLFETMVMGRNGVSTPIELTGKIIYEDEGEPVCIQGTGRDITERKIARENIRESEERYRFLADNVLDCIWVIDMKLTILYVNPIVEQMFGFTVEEMVGKSTLDFMDRQYIEIIDRLVREAAAKGPGGSDGTPFEAVIRQKEGPGLDVEILGKLLWRGDKPVAIQGSLRDITRRKQSERELTEKSIFLDRIIESSAVSTWIADASGTAIRTNAACLEFFGATSDEVIGKYNIFKDNIVAKAGVRPEIEKVFREGVTANIYLDYDFGAVDHVDIKNPKRKYINTIMTPVLNSSNEITHVIIQTIDLTEIKKTENLLRKEKDFTELALNAQQDMFILFDPIQQKAHRWNRAFRELSGYQDDEIAMHPFPEKYHPGNDSLSFQMFIQEVLKYRHGTIELDLCCKNGQIIPIEYQISTLQDDPRQHGYLVAIGRDVSDRKQAEAHKRNLEAQIRHVQKLESLGVLAGGIAHDFNNILMSILGNADLVMEDVPEDSPVKDSLKEIEKATKRAADLCRQMLAYAGKGQFVVKAVSLSRIAEEMIHMLEVAISKRVELVFHLDPNLPLIEADATQIRQILLNFITNASEAIGDSDGIISVSTSARYCDSEFFTGSFIGDEPAPGEYVLLEITDTGCGMDNDTLEKVFDPFFSTKFTGRGLGLAAVLGIVRGHKGAIHVISSPDCGSCFRVAFPVSRKTVQEKPSSKVRAQITGNPLILLVDDESTIRTIGTRMLTRLGCRVLTAEDGLEAIRIYEKSWSEIDCVMLDLTMPQMGGKETSLRLQQINPDVRILFSSGYTKMELTLQELRNVHHAFIQKPYSMSRLTNALMNILTDSD